MPLELNVQFNIVAYSLLAGVLTGLLFDAYRIIRGINKIKIITVIEDLLFWILCTLIIFTFLLYMNYAFLGFYVYIFIIIALIVYIKTVSRYVIKSEMVIFKSIYKVIRISFNNISYPVRIIVSKMGNKNH